MRLSGAVRRNARGPGEDLGGVRILQNPGFDYGFELFDKKLDMDPARPSSPFGWAAD